MKGFSANLKDARLGLGLTQKGLGEVLEVDRKTIVRWEKNYHTPTVPNAIRCQEILKKAEEVKSEESQEN